MKGVFSRMEWLLLTACVILLVFILPALNAAGVLPDYLLANFGKYLCYSVLAISVDVLWGYTGLLSLGQAVFFSLGGYMLGMNLMLMIGKLGSYARDGKNPNLLPDFMVFLGHTFLPWFWRPFHSFGFAAAMVVLVPGMLALGFGFLAFRSRIKGVYFSILTQALTYAVSLMFFRNDLIMGGNNGFTDFKTILGNDVHASSTKRGLFICTAVLLISVFIGCRWLIRTKFGLVQRAIRDSETRVLFSGYAAANYKLLIFVGSSVIAAIGGALYVPQVGIINPSEMTPERSLEAVVWCAVGGRGTLIGPILGAISVNYLKSWATQNFPDVWLILLGGLFIFVVLFMPKGIVGLLNGIWHLASPKRVVEPAGDPKAPIAEPGKIDGVNA